jgi:hypothetical protein
MTKDAADLQIKIRRESILQIENQMTSRNNKEIEKFINTKILEYVEEQRLGKFNPEIY